MNSFLSKKINLNKLILIQTIVFALVFAYSLFKITEWELFPWLNISIATSLPFFALLISMLVKLSSGRIKFMLITFSLFHFFLNLYFLSNPELLRTHWKWLLCPDLIIFCLLFLDLFSRKNDKIKKIGTTLIVVLIAVTLIRFYIELEWLDKVTILISGVVCSLLLFSNSKSTVSE